MPKFQPGRGDGLAHVRRAVGVTQRSLQPHAGIVMGFDREGEQAARREHAGDGSRDRRKVAAIDKDIGRQRQMMRRARLGNEKLQQIRHHEAVVKPLGARLLDHARRNIDSDQPVAIRPERRAAQTRAAAEIEHRAEPQRHALDGPNRLQQQLGSAIFEPLHQRLIEIRRVLVEQPAHIDAGHRRRRLADAEAGQMQPRAVIILAVGVARRRERRDGAVAVAYRLADRGQREPGGGEARRGLHHLHEDIRGGGRVAALEIIQRPLVAPVGDQIAG